MRLPATVLCLSAVLLFSSCGFSDNRTAEAVATNDTAQTSPGQAVTINVLGNDQGSNLTVDSFQARTSNGGTVTRTAAERLVYQPRGGFLRTDAFTYVARNGEGVTSKNGTVTGVVQ